MARDTSSIMLASPWTFNPDANFTVEGYKVEDAKVKVLMKMKDFVQTDIARSLNVRSANLCQHRVMFSDCLSQVPRIRTAETPQIIDHSDDQVQSDILTTLDIHILDLPVDEPSIPVTETWKSQHDQLGHNPSSHTPLLKEIGNATNTEITLNFDSKNIQVSGDTAAHVQQALNSLSNLDTAMMLTRRDPKSYTHHLAPSSNSTQDLRAVPYAEHPATKMMQNLASEDEWNKISSMVSVMAAELPPSTVPNDPSESRYWKNYQFTGFGTNPSVEPQPSIPRSSGSSETNKNSDPSNGSDGLSVEKAEEDSPHPPVEKTPVEKAARVAEWVHHNHEAKNTNSLLIDFDEIEKPERRPTRHPEDNVESIPGLLRRKVKVVPKPVKPVTAQEGKSLLDSMDHWTVLQPQVHRTMAQKSASSTEAGSGPSSKQLTLEDCWRRSPALSKVKTENTTTNPQKETIAAAKVNTVEEKIDTLSLHKTPNSSIIQARQFLSSVQDNHQKKISRRKDAEKIQEVFHGLKPFLTKARCFPGALKLEICFGLIILNSFPTGHVEEEDYLSVEDWNNAFRARNNLQYPFWMWKKLTSSGQDADSLIDLKWSDDNTRRMFEQAPADREVTYEFHCRCGNGGLFIIALDEDGTANIHRPEYTLGTSAIHSPHTVWDTSVLLRGFLKYRQGRDIALDKAIEAFVDGIYLKSAKALYVRCTEPADGSFSVEKILLKRTTRHRHLPLNSTLSSDLMLQVTEVQQFLIGRNMSHLKMIRGRIDLQRRTEWAAKKNIWFEASIVSGTIEKLLQANSNLTTGQRTDEWDAPDLLGDEVDLAGATLNYDTNPVAEAVGSASLGNMLRLGRTVLSQMKIGK
ncbi:uncharacterized protein TRUGW13939_02257 [Talaromyces rugulosus]|uniref:Uncharacterized protein n=1 Tax=Talaromyces rugulosus TaxID=121627 RepID=A0A7H8QNX7_TALRU|nr:uncharacterized protein TRUGW13939_02257 [Talaromyces rugulosus]QKX55165.1 hypothetical protein TRUGW13939_02257 [Talaromyces rugulosus]